MCRQFNPASDHQIFKAQTGVWAFLYFEHNRPFQAACIMFFVTLDRFWRHPFVYFIVLTTLALATPLTFAPHYQFWLMPLLFGGFIRLLELKPRCAISPTYWFSTIAYAAQFWWIHTALHDVSGLANMFAIPLTFLLPIFLALFPATAIWLWTKYAHLPRTWHVGAVLPVLWTLAEFARERFAVNGFGWGAIGYSQIADDSPLAGFAPIGGIHLVTLATTFLSAWLVLFVDGTRIKSRIIAAVGVIALLISGSLFRQISFTQPTGNTVSVALVQGNIAQHLKFDSNQILPTYERYLSYVAQSKAQMIVLPETALPLFLQDTPSDVLYQFAQSARKNGSSLAVGVPMYTKDGSDYLNAIVNLTDYTSDMLPESLPTYAKNHLVPFGEYKPFAALTEPLYRIMNMPLADFKRGGNAQLPLVMAGQKVAFNICYEDGFGDELIASAKQATLLANASNMAWYGDSNAMWQQLQQSQARALELGRYMVRATNTGATAIVSPQGNIVQQLVPNIEAVLEGRVQGMAGETLFMRMGGSLPLISILIVLAIGLRVGFRLPEK